MLELKNINKNYNPGTVNELCLFENFNLLVAFYNFNDSTFNKKSYTFMIKIP